MCNSLKLNSMPSVTVIQNVFVSSNLISSTEMMHCNFIICHTISNYRSFPKYELPILGMGGGLEPKINNFLTVKKIYIL